ncbi:hypothetical protein [Photorhabdus viridis]
MPLKTAGFSKNRRKSLPSAGGDIRRKAQRAKLEYKAAAAGSSHINRII